MRTKIRSITLLALFALFVVMPVWAAELSSDGNGGYYVNMPATGTDNLTITADDIAEGKTSFMLYDDGGRSSNYSNNAEGYLELTAPEGYVFEVTGTVLTYEYDDALFIYDGATTGASYLLNHKYGTAYPDVGVLISAGNSVLFKFVSNASTGRAGMNLEVFLRNVTHEFALNVPDGITGGSITVEPTSATYRTPVSLTVNPASGYLLKDLVITAEGTPVDFDNCIWYSGENTTTFTMPYADVSITPTFTNDLSAEGGLYVNMPITGTETVNIPEGVSSFKVYDDGGVDGMYSNSASGYLLLVAPEGYIMQLQGTVSASTDQSDLLQIFDGGSTSSQSLVSLYLLKSGPRNVSAVKSSSNVALVSFRTSNSNNGDGIDLTVTLLDASVAHEVSVAEDVTGGTISIEPMNATIGSLVTVTANPAEGYILDGIFVEEVSGKRVAVTGGDWRSANEATFVMPYSDVIVTPSFMDEYGELSLVIPQYGTDFVNVAAGVPSLKIYDHNGGSANYYSRADGYLVLTAPEGYALLVSGSVTTDADGGDYLTIYNGDSESAPVILSQKSSATVGKAADIGELVSSGRSLTFYFHSDNQYEFEGIDLTVSVVSPHSISIAPVQGGSVSGVESAIVNETVTLTAVPDEGFILDGFIAYSNGNAVNVHFDKWNNAATFVMPNDAVSITPVFVSVNDLFVNMPVSGTDTVDIPEGVTTLKVYDDGGSAANYSNAAKGYLILTAPEGMLLRVTGTLTAEGSKTDNLTIYDGTNNALLLNAFAGTSNGVAADIGNVLSLGNSLKLYFKTDNTVNFAGLDLTVTVEDPSVPYTVTLNSADGGIIASNVTSASVGTLVTLTATPEQNYVLMGVSVTDGNNSAVQVVGGQWYSANTATFLMPSSNVVVTPVFSSILTVEEFFVNMPVTGTLVAKIPDGVTSFNVYDDGGKDGLYSNNVNGYIELVASKGSALNLSRTMTDMDDSDNLEYDAGNGVWVQANSVQSVDSTIKIHFHSDASRNGEGFENLVTVETLKSVTIAPVEGGTAVADKNYVRNGYQVTLTATPESGKVLKGITVVANENPVSVSWSWYNNVNTATFAMPNADVTVTPEFADALSAEDGIYINLPALSSLSVTVPDGVTSFKVYDDGGANASYSSRASGYLELTASEGKIFRVTGSMITETGYDKLTIFDGGTSATKLMNAMSGTLDAIDLMGTSNTMTFYFSSDNGAQYAGLDLTVTVIDLLEPHAVTFAEGIAGGTLVADHETAAKDSVVTLTATPDAGHVLAGVMVVDSIGNNIEVTGGAWPDNSASFVMPGSPVTVTPVFLTNATVDDGLYLNMPVTGTRSVTIPSAVSSFRVYDDGGKDEPYSNNANGYLQLVAPEGNRLQIGGLLQSNLEDRFVIYDGDVTAATLIDRTNANVNFNPVMSTGNVVTIYFSSNESLTGTGLKLTVNNVDVSKHHEIHFADALNGSISADVATATMGTLVTLTAIPSENYVLKGVSVRGASSVVTVDGGTWAFNNVATFTMPYSDVTVTPVFATDLTADDGLYVNLPLTGTQSVSVPAGVKSFKVYDNGGASGYYHLNTSSSLELTAPEGCVFKVTGTVSTEPYDFAAIYDGINTSVELYNGVTVARVSSKSIGTVLSSGNKMTIYFSSNYSASSDGVDFTVSVLHPSEEYSVTLADGVTGGTVSISPSSATMNTLVSITATPASGYILNGIVAKDGFDGNAKLDGECVFGGTCQFTMTMPSADVLVTPSFNNDFATEEDKYINMPVVGTIAVTIPEDASPFKVYDDGGKDETYSDNADGFIKLIAPPGRVIQVSGSVKTYTYGDALMIYDGADTASVKLLDRGYGSMDNLGPLVSSGNVALLRFVSGMADYKYYGLDLVVNVVDPLTPHSVTLSGEVTGGTLRIAPQNATYGDTISLTPVPASGNMLKQITAVDENGHDVKINGNCSMGNVCRFVMPLSNVLVTPVFTDDLTAEGGLYANIPATGVESVAIPSGVASFKVYDDGGSDGKYSHNADGNLELVAPTGYVLQIEGTFASYAYDYLTIYDGSIAASTLLSDKSGTSNTDLGTMTSTSNVVTFNIKTNDNSNYTGLNATVTLVASEGTHSVSVSAVSNGSMESDYAEAQVGDVVTLTATPENGFVLTNVVIQGCEDNMVGSTGGWYSNNQITFTMPSCDVVVTPSFGEDYVINMPVRGKKTANIPAGVSSFKVYDDGGSEGNYSANADGYLELIAPEGYGLSVTGTMVAKYKSSDNLTIYDGTEESSVKLLDAGGATSSGAVHNVGPFASSGRTMTLFFHSTSGATYRGLDLDVELVDLSTTYSVTFAEGIVGGTVSANPGNPTFRTEVELTATTDADYYLSGIDVVIDESGEKLTVTNGWWFTGNTAVFTMPAANVTVIPTFVTEATAEDARYINMPATGRKIANIPADVGSFKVYDDGGKDDAYSNRADGQLVLVAPEGYVFLIEGDVSIPSNNSDGLSVYDGDTINANKRILSTNQSFESYRSMSNTVCLYFYSDASGTGDGLDLTITLKDASEPELITVSEGASVNMPWRGISVATIPEGVASFKVYDEGGENGNYSGSGLSYLVLTAPEGCKLQLAGSMETRDYWDKLTIFDGDTLSPKFLYAVSGTKDVGPLLSSGNVMTLYFDANSGDNYAGLDFDVRVINPAVLHTVTILSAEGGTVNIVGEEERYEGDTISLAVTANTGYVFKEISADAGGIPVLVMDQNDLSGYGTAKFVMPNSDVTVTPIYVTDLTASDGLYVTTPVTGTKRVSIPAGVSSFNVYDDGGANANYSKNATGILELEVPQGYAMIVTGTARVSSQYACTADPSCFCSLYIDDGVESSGTRSLYANSSWSTQATDVGILTGTKNAMTIAFHTNENSTYDGLNLNVDVVYVGLDYHVTFDVSPVNNENDVYLVLAHGDLWKNGNLEKVMNSEENGAFLHLYRFGEDGDGIPLFDSYKWSPVLEEDEDDEAILASYNLTPAILATTSSNEDPLSINLYPSRAGQHSSVTLDELPIYAYVDGSRVQELLDYHGKLVLSQTLGGKDYTQESFSTWAADDDDVDHQALYIPRSVDYGDTLVYDVSTMPDPGYVMFIDEFVDDWVEPTVGDVQDPPAGEGWGYDADTRTLKIASAYMPYMEFKVRYELKTYNVTFEVPSSNSGVFVANEMVNNAVAMNWFDSYTDLTMMNAPSPAVYNANGCRIAWKVKGRNVENREAYELVGEIPFMVSTMDDASAVNALELDLQHPVCPNVDNGTGPTYLQTLQVEEGNGQLILVQTVGDTVINHEFVNGQMTVPVHASDATKQEVGVTLKVIATPDPGYVLKQLTYDMVVDGDQITALVEDGASVNVKQGLTWHVKFSNYEPIFVTYDLSLGAGDSSNVWLPSDAVAESAINVSYNGSATDMWKPYRTDKCFAGWAPTPDNPDFIFTAVDTSNIQMFSKDATNPTALYAIWYDYGNGCDAPSAYVHVYPRYFEDLYDASNYNTFFTDTLVVTQNLGDAVFTHKGTEFDIGTNLNGYIMSFDVLPQYGHEFDSEDTALQVTSLSSNALAVLEGGDGVFAIGANGQSGDYFVGVKDQTMYKVVLSANAGDATVFYGENWSMSSALRVGEVLPDGSVFRRDACFTGWSFDPNEAADYNFDYNNRLGTFGEPLLQQRMERLAAGLSVDTLYAKWDKNSLGCMSNIGAELSLNDDVRHIATVTLYQEVEGVEVEVLKIDSGLVEIPSAVESMHNKIYAADNIRFTRVEVTANPGATLGDTYQLSYVTLSDNESHEFARGVAFEDDIEFQVNGVSRNTYRVAYNENAGDANVFYGEHWGATEEVFLNYGLSSSLFRTDACLVGWSFGENSSAGYVYNTVDADFVSEYDALVAGDAPVNLYAVWSTNSDNCLNRIENVEVSLSNDLKGVATVELIQTVGGEPKVVATVGEEGISIPKMQATEVANDNMVFIMGENGYFSGLRVVPATGYELVEGVNPSYKVGNADAVEVTDATPAWIMDDETVLSGTVASTGYTVTFNENGGNANVFYPADWSETGSYNIVDNDGTAFPKLYRTDKCLVGWGFSKDASRAESFDTFNPVFVTAYDSVVAAGVESPVLYGVWNECTQALYKVTLNDIAEGTLVLSHNGKAYNVPSTGFVVPEASPALEFGLAFTPNLGYKLADEGSFNLVDESGVIQSVVENNTLAVDGDKIVDAPVATLENTFAFVTNAGNAVLFYGDDWVESATYSLDAQNVNFPKGIYRVDSCFTGWALNTESERTHLQFNTDFLDDVEATRNAGLPVDRLYAIWGACETEQTIVTVANADSLSGTFTLSRTVSQTAKTYTVAGTALQVPADESLAFAVTFVPNKGYTYDETVGITAVDATDAPVSMNAGELVVATSLTLSAAATADTYTFALNENAGNANVFYTGSLATEFTAKVIDDAATRAIPMNLYRSDACLEGWNFSATAMAGFSQLDDEFVDAYNDFVAAGNDAPTTLYAVWNENCHQTLYTVSSYDKRKGTLTLVQGNREFVVDTAGLKVPSVAGGLAFTATFTPAAGYAYDATQGLEAFNNMSQSMGVLTDGALTVTKTTVLKAVSLTASTYELAFNVNAGNATVYYGDAWRAGTEQTSFSFANAGDFPSDIYRTDSCLAGWTLSTSATAGIFTEFSDEFVDSVAAMDNFDGKLFAKWGNCIAVNNVTVAQVTSAAGTMTLKQTDAVGNVLNTIDIDDAEVTLPLGNGDVTFVVSFTVGEGYSLVDGDYFYTVNANGKNVQALLGNKLTLAGNTLLRAPVLSDAYTITFNTNAGDANVFYGAGWISEGQFSMEMNEVARTFPTEVYRVGYTLAGWSLTPAGNSGDYVFDTELATALKESGKTQVTLYAVWTAATNQQTYTVTLDDAAAGSLTASQTVGKTTATFRVGEDGLEVPAVTGGLTFDVTATMNAGYFADGEKLYLLAAGGARIDSLASENGELVVDGSKIVEIPYESDGVEFAFDINTDARVFYEDGWTGSGAFALNGDTAFPTGILRTEGKLLGWALSRTSTKYYKAYNGTFVNDLKNYKALGLPTNTLYAVWSEYGLFDNVNVTNGNDKNGSFVITQTVNGVETEPITINADGIQIPYSEKGLTFNVKFETKPGYYLNAEEAISGANAAGTSIGNAVNGGALVFKSNTDVVLSASVDANRFKFNYNVNGGDAYVFYGTDWSSTDEKSLNDTSVVFPTNIYRNDACLQGWSIDPADSTGSTLLTSDFIATLDRVQNVNTLYAVWKECEVETYTVTFENTNVGSLVLSQSVDDSLVTFAVEEDGLKVPVVPGGLRFKAAYTLKAGYAGNTDTLFVVDDITGILTTLADNALTVNENITLAIPTVGETFKLVFDVNREGRLFYGSDWMDSAIYMLSDKKSTIPLPNYVYTSEACMVGWSIDSTGGETYLKFNTDLAAALLENKSADSTYKLYAIWGKGSDCDELYDRVTFTGNHGTVHLAEAPRGDKTEFIEHEFMNDGSMILPKTMNGNNIRVFAVPDSSYALDSLVMTREGSDEERQVFIEGDALVFNLMDAKFVGYFGKANRTKAEFANAEVLQLGNAIRFAFGTSDFEATRKVAVSVRLETIDGELVAADTITDSIPRPYNGAWDKFPLAAGKYVLTATMGDEGGTDEFVETFEVKSEIATVSEEAWQIISIANLDKDAMVWDDDDARFYWWDESSASGDYWQYREFNPKDEIVPTRGYWYSSLEGRPLVLKPESDVKVADKVEWKLDSISSGWNLVANPYGFALDIYADHPAENIDQTDATGITFWRWDASLADYVPAFIVQPYEAVWVKVTAPTDWTIPVAPRFDTDNPDSEFEEDSSDVTLKALAKARRLTKANGKNDWRLQMVLSDAKGHKDSWNMLGASHNAFTTEEPPEGMGDHVKLSIVEGNRMLAKSVKAPADEQDWTIALSANSERYGELSFKGVDDINTLGLKVFVTVDGKTTEMHDGMTLRVLLKSSATMATVHVGASAKVVADLHIDGLRSVQAGRSLNVSFNASAELAGTRTVVEILNMDGKVIASRSAKTLAGTNAFAFDAPRGGIYLLRVRAGSQIKAGRIMVR